MKCACGKKDCINEIHLSMDGIRIFHEKLGKEGELLMYFDANALVSLIREARIALNFLAGGKFE